MKEKLRENDKRTGIQGKRRERLREGLVPQPKEKYTCVTAPSGGLGHHEPSLLAAAVT